MLLSLTTGNLLVEPTTHGNINFRNHIVDFIFAAIFPFSPLFACFSVECVLIEVDAGHYWQDDRSRTTAPINGNTTSNRRKLQPFATRPSPSQTTNLSGQRDGMG